LTAGVAIAVAALSAGAADRPAPVQVDAENVLYAFQKREVTFTGKAGRPVVMRRDDARLTCLRLVARTDEAGQIVSAACSGDVRFTRGDRVVTCERATYEGVADRIVCEGNPVLREGGAEARGARLVYDLRSDEAKLEGAVITVPGDEVEQRRREIEQRRRESGR
jgi:lipopolysaccharide export system protein LptA